MVGLFQLTLSFKVARSHTQASYFFIVTLNDSTDHMK